MGTGTYVHAALRALGHTSQSPSESWVTDRVGSEVSYYSGYDLYSTQLDHYPYGEQRNGGERSPTYATYLGNSFTGLDYARMRHYSVPAGRFMTPDPYGGSASLTDSQSWNRYAYLQGDPVNHNDPCGLLPANIYFEGGRCVPGGFFGQPGGIDASNPCPPGYTMMWGGPGASSTRSRLQQVMEAMEPLDALIENWEFSHSRWNRFDITVWPSAFFQAFTPQVVGVGTLGGTVLLGGTPVGWVIVGGSVVVVGVHLWQTGMLADLLDSILWRKGPKGQAIGKPKGGLPTGTKPIDETDLSKDQIHDVKDGIEARPADWVGVDPNGNVWTGSPSGEAVNHGPWDVYTNP